MKEHTIHSIISIAGKAIFITYGKDPELLKEHETRFLFLRHRRMVLNKGKAVTSFMNRDPTVKSVFCKNFLAFTEFSSLKRGYYTRGQVDRKR